MVSLFVFGVPGVLRDFDVFGFGLEPLLFRSGSGCFSGDMLSRSVLIVVVVAATIVSDRLDVVGLVVVVDSFRTLSDASFF